MILALALLCLSAASLFIGVIDLTPSHLITGGAEQLEILLISRLPRLLAILCTGVGMSVAGLMMQQLCMNKFVSPTTGATISSAQFGILLALLFMPGSTLWGRALFAFGAALAGTWSFVWVILTENPSPYCGDFVSPEQIVPHEGIRNYKGDIVPWELCLTM